MSIKIGILGYGNLGRGVECAIKHNPDMELVAVFTRRDPKSLHIQTPGVPVYAAEDAVKMAYFLPDDDPTKEPVVTWRSAGQLLFSNWLNYYVYQTTPYDIGNK